MKERKGKSSAPIADRHLVDGSLQDWWYLRFFRVDWRVHFLPFSIPFLFLLISTINWLCKEWERQRERERERETAREEWEGGGAEETRSSISELPLPFDRLDFRFRINYEFQWRSHVTTICVDLVWNSLALYRHSVEVSQSHWDPQS